MNIGLQLMNEQQLRLSLTPTLKQSIDILQLNSLDLASYLQEIATENPVIDVEFHDFGALWSRRRKAPVDSDVTKDMIDLQQARGLTLEEELLRQIRLSDESQAVKEAACFLAGNLTETGFLDITLEQACMLHQVPVQVMERGLQLLQQQDPPGIGARNLQECLDIQIRRDPTAPSLASVIVNEHFLDLAYGRWDHIRKKQAVSAEQVSTAVAYIRTLQPRPGLLYGDAPAVAIIPDGQVYREGNRNVVRIFDDYLPKINIQHEYTSLVSQSSSEAHHYIKQKVQQATWIIRCIKQRKQTLYQVMHAIFEFQHEFLRHGDKSLKPLRLKDISERLCIHESTVSRAVQNKFIQTPSGIVPLKHFFTNAITNEDGQATSQPTIKNRIKELIDQEDKRNPLSDNRLAELLKKEGIHVSRRTVAKYREELNILSSFLRRSS